MAWRASCPILSSSLHSDDLMSDIEPLPASGPNSAPTTPSQTFSSFHEGLASSRLHSQPSSPFGCRSGSSEVTAQLYASLRRSREVEAQARAHLEPPSSARRTILGPDKVSTPLNQEDFSPKPVSHSQQRTDQEDTNNQTSSALSSPSSHRSTSPLSPVCQELEDHSRAGLQEPPGSSEDCPSNIGHNSGSMDNQSTKGHSSNPEEGVPQKLAGDETSTLKRGGSRHILEMEKVRSHLQGMLRKSMDPTSMDPPYRKTQFLLPDLGDKEDDSFMSDSTATLLNARSLQEISPPLSVTSMEDFFPRYSGMRPRSDQEPSSYNELQLIRDSLERETTRRKLLERHDQNLQNRVLELQQQLAIATSADKKKNTMIEQLDKTLAKLMDGWNKQEAERNDYLKRLHEDRAAAQQAKGQQQERISKLEKSLSQAVEALSREQLEGAELRKQIEMHEKEKRILVRSLESEKQRGQSLQSQQEEAVAAHVHEQKRLETLRATLEEEQESWAIKERQLEERYERLQEESQRQLESEKARSQKEARQALDAKQALASAQSQVQQLESELDATRRERDSMQMDITLLKARHESQRMKLESELKASLEQQVAERLAEVHEENSRQMASVREQHRKQLLELSSNQEKEMANQVFKFKEELMERDDKIRRVTEDYEGRLDKLQEEMRELAAAKKKLEFQRSDMVGRLQSMMQSHWNEALRVLMNEASPQAMKVRQVEKEQSESNLPFSDSKNTVAQKTMAVPPSKSQPLPPSQAIQQKFFEIQQMKNSLTNAVSEMQAGEGFSIPSQTNVQNQAKPKAAVQSFHSGHPGMTHVPSRMAGTNDNASNSWGTEPAFPQTNQRASQRPVAKERELPSKSNGPGGRAMLSDHLPSWSEEQRNFLQASQSQFYPLIASGRLTADLSQLLNHSFASQMSFSPLEAQADETGMSTALGYHHDELAEHPFSDDTENATVSEVTASEGNSFQNTTQEARRRSSLPPTDIQRPSLQHCIRLLLDRTPGDPLNEKQAPHSMSQFSLLQSDHLGYRDRSTGIWDHVRQPPAGHPAVPSIPQAVQKTKVSEVAPESHSREPYSPPKDGSAPAVQPLTPRDVAEISRLLGLYQDHPGHSQAEELFGYLQIMERAGLEVKEDPTQVGHGNPSARRSLDPKLNDAVKKAVVPSQVSAPRHPSSARASNEKLQISKTVKKPAPLPTQSSVKSNRSGVWR
ncbi:centrobin isoform X2 [Ambystoma mexicanum]|uniref:centrobin isoform X2 n=1 Tax=Ambystoma mexicanum TaxID=8296 RepID=UPI0037E9AAE0